MRLDSIPVDRPSRRKAAERAVVLVGRLDARLDTLRPTETEEPSGSPVGRAWDTLLGTVARAPLRADELLAAATPPRAKNDQVYPTRRRAAAPKVVAAVHR